MNSIYRFYRDLNEEKISMIYFGLFTNNITRLMINITNDYYSRVIDLSSFRKKSSFLIGESFQNIVKHGIKEKQPLSKLKYNKDFFKIGIHDDRIVISSGNVINSKNVPNIKEKIDHINSLSDKELKALKQKVLEFGEVSEKGGAGLGLIEMVRKSGLPLIEKLIPLDDDYTLLMMKAEMPVNKEIRYHKVDINEIESIYYHLNEDNILILYKGDFSSDSITNLIGMLENNFTGNEISRSEQAHSIFAVIEVLENVSRHGETINGHVDGIIVVKFINEEIYVECGNIVKYENYQPLKEKLESIKSTDIEEIERYCKDKLKDKDQSKNSDSGFGLYEIARFTNNEFGYNLVETEENKIFFSIEINLG
jgi:hypothetical protein